MKRIIYTFLIGLVCSFMAIGQPNDLILNTSESGTRLHQATNSITFAAGYSYTPAGGTMLAEIVGNGTGGTIYYAQAINPDSYVINTVLPVDKTSGELDVSGMASYNVPLDLPKGTAGLQPTIGLNYLSSFSDGLMGIGWNIGGLSAISRTGQNWYFENQSQPVKGDLNDRFMLDGKRLIVTNGYAYGSDESVYGTEIEEFSKITAKGSSGTERGPAWFEVRTKSGLICEYGNTADSKVLFDAACVSVWKVNKITDRYGNCIFFSYLESDDERPILQIRYAGSTSTLAEVNFLYKQRSDLSTYVYGGKEFTRDILLDNIEIKNNGQTLRKYILEYMLDNYAQLQKITEYTSQNQPLNPLVFTYTKQTNQFSQSVHYSSTVRERFFHGDFNGDGRIDFVVIPAWKNFDVDDKWKLYLSDNNGDMVFSAEGTLDSSFKNFIAADMDGDGLADLIRISSDSFAYYRSTGSGFIANPSFGSVGNSTRFEIVDYDGDRELEIMRISSEKPGYSEFGNWYEPTPAYYAVYSIAGNLVCSGNFDSFGTSPWGYRDLGEFTKIVDFNGDGCSDILALFSYGYKLFEFKGVNNELIETSTGGNLKNNYLLALGDYNGDGTTDVISTSPATSSNWYFVSLFENEFKRKPIDGFSTFNTFKENNQFYSADINGDGKMDIVIVGNGTDTNNSKTRINVAINKGNGYDYTFSEYESELEFRMGLYQANVPPITWEEYYSTFFFYFADYNGDGRDELFFREPHTKDSRCFTFATGTPSNLLNNVIDGLGARARITYKPMSDATVYTRGAGAAYPLCDFSSGMQLVGQVDSDDGIEGLYTTTYRYQGAKIHQKGKGFLGFTKITQTNGNTNVFTENNYTFDSPHYYPKLMTSYTKQGSVTMSTITNIWEESVFNETNRVFPYISVSIQKDNLKDQNITTSVVYPLSNLYGNPESISKSYSPGPTETVSFGYFDEKVDEWLIGRPTLINKISMNGGATYTYQISRAYSPTSNDPDIDQNNSGDDSWWQLNRDYDAWGNLWKEHKTAAGLNETHVIYDYDAHGINLIKTTDQTGNETSYTYYPTTGLLNTQTDPFGNRVIYNYNLADQLSSIAHSTGISSTITSSFNVSGGPGNARYYVDKTGNDGSQTKVWYDRLGRELRTETRKFGGTLVKVDKQYNAKGELIQYSEPATGIPTSWNTMGYDAYGRVDQLSPAFGPIAYYSYNGNKTYRIFNERVYSATENAAGWITQTTDPGGTINNGYEANGLLRSTSAFDVINSSMTYDRNGNRLSINDPSAGTITNTWYGTGQPKTLTNANGQTTTYSYTPDQKVQLQKITSEEGETNYTYYPDGLVNTITSPGGVSRSYTYELGKVKTIAETIGAESNLVTFEYDLKGRLYRKYFNGTTDYEQYDYDTNSGYLYRILFNGTIVWQLTNMDEYKRITQANIGSTSSTWNFDSSTNLLSDISATGVQRYMFSFDGSTGNLNSRVNLLKSKAETFEYDTDKLDRLTSVAGPSSLSVGYTTDKNGNILTKSDAGTYVYDAIQPYAVDQISNGQNISKDEQTIDYYSFGKVKKITEGTTTIKTADFDYNADNQRIRMVLKTDGTATKSRYYFGGSCEREVVGSTATQYIWIGGDAYSAVAVARKIGTGTWTVYNIFRDHLGTITHLKNSSTIDEYSFDAWGRRRDKDDWTYTLTSEPALFADRGFTGHEYLEDFKLYNMNGRMYDPVVGRFLSPDPYIQDPGFTQNLNRYSYCLNNPLKYNDPTGNKWNWNWLNPLYWFETGMQALNDNTTQLRQNMAKAGVPDFGVGVNVNGAGNVRFNGNYMGQQVFNTQNIDRSGPSIENTLNEIELERAKYRVAQGQGGGGLVIGAQRIAAATNAADIVISTAEQTIKTTRAGANFAYAISGSSKLASVVSNTIKYTPYVGLSVTTLTGYYLSRTINPATNQPYQSWTETGADIGVNIATMYIGAKYGGWYGAGAAVFYIGVKTNVQYQMNSDINPGHLFIIYKE